MPHTCTEYACPCTMPSITLESQNPFSLPGPVSLRVHANHQHIVALPPVGQKEHTNKKTRVRSWNWRRYANRCASPSVCPSQSQSQVQQLVLQVVFILYTVFINDPRTTVQYVREGHHSIIDHDHRSVINIDGGAYYCTENSTDEIHNHNSPDLFHTPSEARSR
jgi:hypothetical protein